MKINLKTIAIICFFIAKNCIFLSQTTPPNIAKRTITWAWRTPIDPRVIPSANFLGQGVAQSQAISGEDWWYDVKSIYEQNVHVGYIVCGFTTFKNMYFSEHNMNPKGFFNYSQPAPASPCEGRSIRDETISQYKQTIARFDLNGNQLWCKPINTGGPFLSVIQANDGNFIAIGEMGAAYKNDLTPFIYNPTGINDQPITSLVNDPSLFPQIDYLNKPKVNVVKIDNNGNVIWNYLYGSNDLDGDKTYNTEQYHSQRVFGFDIDRTADGTGYVFAGLELNDINPRNIAVFKIDENGILLNKKNYGDLVDVSKWPKAMDCEGGDCYVVGGQSVYIQPDNTRPAFIFKFNESDLLLSSDWGSTWNQNNPKYILPNSATSAILEDIEVSSSGKIVCTALLNNNGGFYSGTNFGEGAIVELSSNGIPITTTPFGEVRAFDLKIGLTKLKNGGYAVVSSKRTKNSLGQDIIPDWNTSPYLEIMTDYFTQANYTCSQYDFSIGIWNTDTYIAKFSDNLSMLWDKQFDSDDLPPLYHPRDFKKQECMYRIAEGDDGSLVAIGNSSHNLDDYLFVKLFSDCQNNMTYDISPTNNVTIINSNTVWNSNKTVKGKIIIPYGKKLTINNSTIEFADPARHNFRTKIVVEPGGELVVNNSILTSIQSCEKAMWEGIEVQGNPNLNQIISSNQGKATIKNSIIRNAKTAITTTARMSNDVDIYWARTGGGIVNVTNTKFHNNMRSFEFMSYQPTSSTGSPINDKSYISDCEFITDDDFGDGGATENTLPSITMWNTRKINVIGNKFENLRQNIPLDKKGIGIYTIDATISITPLCNSSNIADQNNCPPNLLKKNEFINLYTGVSISSGTNLTSCLIDKAIFDNNVYGIRIEGSHFGEIRRCEFNIPKNNISGQLFGGFGIYSNSTFGFKFEQNTFNGLNSNDLYPYNLGIYMENSDVLGGGISTYRNDFNNLTSGTEFSGSNSNADIDCNRFLEHQINSLVDIYVNDGIVANQGSCGLLSTDPQANEFLRPCGTINAKQIGNFQGQSFDYNSYPTSFVGFDAACVNGDIISSNCVVPNFNRAQACPTDLTRGSKKERIVRIVTDIEILKNKIDGGNSSAVLQFIESNTNPSVIRNYLQNKAPYLSIEVQKAVIEKNIPAAVKKQILELNAPFKVKARENIQNSSMPNAIKNQLLSSTGVSPLETLEKAINQLHNEKKLIENELLSVYIDSNYVDSVNYIIESRESIESKLTELPLIIQSNPLKTISLISDLNDYATSIAEDFPLKSQDLKTTLDFYSFILPIVSREGGYLNLTLEEREYLESLANSGYTISKFATSILNFQHFDLKPVDGKDINFNRGSHLSQNETSEIAPSNETKIAMSTISIFPNPTNGLIEIKFNEFGLESKTIAVHSIDGTLVKEYLIKDESLIIDLSNSSTGIYFVKVNNDEVSIIEKIILSK